MGQEGQADDFTERLSELASTIWTNFIDEEVAELLDEEQTEKLAKLFENEETTEEDFSTLLTDIVPDFDDMYRDKVLENKAVAVEGRIKQLGYLSSGESDKSMLLDDCEDLIEEGEWLKVQDILVKDFSEY